jgi:predicted nucleic acid-binding protein
LLDSHPNPRSSPTGIAAGPDGNIWFTESIVIKVAMPSHHDVITRIHERRRRSLSLVDAVSFVAMRQRQLVDAFAFAPHFEQEGFSLVG